MKPPPSEGVTRRSLRVLDVLVGTWVLAWVGIGIWVGIDVHQLGGLAITVRMATRALEELAQGLGAFAQLPFVGGDLRSIAAKANATALATSRNAGAARTNVDQLAYLLGIVIAVVPSVPTIAAYLPYRVRRGYMQEVKFSVRRSPAELFASDEEDA